MKKKYTPIEEKISVWLRWTIWCFAIYAHCEVIMASNYLTYLSLQMLEESGRCENLEFHPWSLYLRYTSVLCDCFLKPRVLQIRKLPFLFVSFLSQCERCQTQLHIGFSATMFCWDFSQSMVTNTFCHLTLCPERKKINIWKSWHI